MSYPAIAKVKFYDEVYNRTDEAVHLLQVYNFQDAAKQLEDYYGEDIEAMTIDIFEEGLITFPDTMYQMLKDIMEGNE